ncbi:hypothetical protein BGZ94_006333 [Podila epigama]|nr:hypothetical protein BGZ94_006333 [Podila epigama]
MPASPKTLKAHYGLPARYPSYGRRCHSQRRILFLVSIMLLISSGSMIVFHITSPFSRSSPSCLQQHDAASSSTSDCAPAYRSSRWRAEGKQSRIEPLSDEDQEYYYLLHNPERNSDNNRLFKNHDRPRAALPHLDDKGVPGFDQPKQQQQLSTPAPAQPPVPAPEQPGQPAQSVSPQSMEEHQAPAPPTAHLQGQDTDSNIIGKEQTEGSTNVENTESPHFINDSDNDNNNSDGHDSTPQEYSEDDGQEPGHENQHLSGLTSVDNDGTGNADDNDHDLDPEAEPIPIPFEDTLESISDDDNDDDDDGGETKYLTYLPYAGITNQFYGMLRGMEVAKATGRTLIIPPITASSHDKSKQNQPWSKFLDLDRFTALTGIRVVEFHQLRDQELAEMSSLQCGITCGFGSKRDIDFTAKGFLKQWKFDLTLTPLSQDANKLQDVASLLRAKKEDRYLCISNTYKIAVKDKKEWERFGQHLHFTQDLEEFVQSFLDKNLGLPDRSGQDGEDGEASEGKRSGYIAIHARRGDFFQYCSSSFPGEKFKHCFPSTDEFAERVDQIQTRLNPSLSSSSSSSSSFTSDSDGLQDMLPVFVATNERRPEELKRFADLGWQYLDHDAMGTVDALGIFGPMMVDQVFMAHAQVLVGVRMSTFSRVGALRQQDWHQRTVEYM